MDRAILSVDGNCGCALLGENLQEGEAEFVEIKCSEPQWTKAYRMAAWEACCQHIAGLSRDCRIATFHMLGIGIHSMTKPKS